MTKAKCFKCGASATGKTFEEARQKLDHAVGMSRGIKCGDNYGKVFEVKDKPKPPPPQKLIKTEIPKVESSEPQPETLPQKEKKSKKPKV